MANFQAPRHERRSVGRCIPAERYRRRTGYGADSGLVADIELDSPLEAQLPLHVGPRADHDPGNVARDLQQLVSRLLYQDAAFYVRGASDGNGTVDRLDSASGMRRREGNLAVHIRQRTCD